MSYTAISLFCGAGGCSAGFQKAGYNILLASDIDKAVIGSYKANFPHTNCLESDVCNIDFQKTLAGLGLLVGELDILIGGPPCQGFSTAGMRFWEDPRNVLLKQYIQALQTMRPKWFLMENVEGLLTADKGKYIFEIVNALIESGYQIRVEKVYTQEYGIPQRRKRVLIIGNRLGIDFKLPEPQGATHGRIFRYSDTTLKHTIIGLPQPSHNSQEKIAYTSEPTSTWEKYLRGTATEVEDHFSPKMADLQLARIQALQPGQTMKDLPIKLQHESFKRRANRRVMDGTASEKRGGSPSGLKRLFFDEPSLTITGAATREFIHPEANRPLTIREAARIQTFPDDFRFLGNTSEKIQQIGNAIPPLLSYILANHIQDNYGFDEVHNHLPGRLLGFTLTKASAMSPALKITEQRLAMISGLNYGKQLTLIG
jgi:DNA (cytosine-5)-methyltransferase 1